MTNHVLLNNVDHKNLKVITERSAQYGDNVMFSPTFPMEFRNIQAHYPIVFRKNENGSFTPVALFGLEKNENLFLTEAGWDSPYLPLVMECPPFLIGFQNISNEGVESKQSVVHIDMDNLRVNEEEGQAVFREHGGNSEYLTRISSILQAVHDGYGQIEIFANILGEYDLLESFAAEIELKDGSHNRLVGFYTINEGKLNQLSESALGKLQHQGFLQSIYMQIASLSQFRALIERKNHRLK